MKIYFLFKMYMNAVVRCRPMSVESKRLQGSSNYIQKAAAPSTMSAVVGEIIIDPNTNEIYSIYSKQGKNLLKKFIHFYKTGSKIN